MQLSPSIFKAYDIRGVTPSTLNEEIAEALGRAFGATALAEGERTVAVGRDGRLSGPAMSAALIRGLSAAGVDVIDIGMVTTPMLYFAASTSAWRILPPSFSCQLSASIILRMAWISSP